ncbi:MAG: response regulator [Bryobacteraceae bacterium]
MPPETLRVLLVEDDEADVRLIEAALAGDSHLTYIRAARLSEALERLGRERVDLILLDLGLPDSQGIDTLVRAHLAAPAVPIIVLTGLDDDDAALAALEHGAQDYLVKGRFDAPALRRAARYAIARFESASAATDGRNAQPLVGFVGAKGGCGATTLASHAAAELARQTGQRTLLVDLDLVAGAIAFLMKIGGGCSIVDATDHAERLDESLWDGLVAKTPLRVDVLAAPPPLSCHRLPKPGHFASVLRFARPRYSAIVLDLGRGVTEFSLPLVLETDRAVIVTTAEVLALSRARQFVKALEEHGLPAARLSVAVNRFGETHGRLSRAEVEEVVGAPVDLMLPELGAELERHYTNGRLAEPGSALGKPLASWCARLLGADAAPAKKRTFQLFGGKVAS